MSVGEKELTWLEHTAKYWFLAVPFMLGLVVFGLGFIPRLALWQSVFFGAGSTLCGSALGTVLGSLAGARLQRQVVDVQKGLNDLYKRMTEIMSNAVQSPWNTKEEILRLHRICLHCYHRTRKGDNEFWIYTPLDFSTYPQPGCLYAQQTIPMDGRDHVYVVEGLLIDQRLVLTLRAREHGESVAIQVFRDYGMGLHREEGYWGLYVHLDWNGNDGADPCILIPQPFAGTEPPGRQTPEFSAQLTQRWLKLTSTVGLKSC